MVKGELRLVLPFDLTKKNYSRDVRLKKVPWVDPALEEFVRCWVHFGNEVEGRRSHPHVFFGR